MGAEGDEFEWEASETGRQPYYCSPHAGFMYGALEIE
ncbi:cupredoxin domain-containing protein [Natrarchaeobius chitinivorans]|nr:plastocyanin/azurin family copper-binding protein [Natrarchaeobius chitinivorans]